MTGERLERPDVLGLGDTWPCPGWVVLDAAREHAFSGEIEFGTTPPLRAYLERGRIYVAERVTDPPLGARLVDAGALEAVQLEKGTIRIGDVDHLGRLFDRAPSVDRQTVTVTLELMTEEAVAWVASQTVRGAAVTPYRRHPAGVHRWDLPSASLFAPPPGSPLPAPAPGDVPENSPVPLLNVLDELDDLDDPGSEVVIHWAEPDMLDERGRPRMRQHAEVSAGGSRTGAPGGAAGGAGGEALADEPDLDVPPLPPPALPRGRRAYGLEGFELIWPTGEVDEQFLVPPDPLPANGVSGEDLPPQVGSDDEADDEPFEFTFTLPDLETGPSTVEASPVSDDVIMAVRRAIATIETGAPSWTPPAHRRANLPRATLIVPAATPDQSAPEAPGRSDTPAPAPDGVELIPQDGAPVVNGPFDAIGPDSRQSASWPTPGDPFDVDPFAAVERPAAAATPARRSALKRLIAGLRRR